jgi:hypothetical protein
MEQRGEPFTHVDGGVLEQWYRHGEACAVWTSLWSALEMRAHDIAGRRGHYHVAFDLPDVGEVRRGPYMWEEAIAERNRLDQQPNVRVVRAGRSVTSPVAVPEPVPDEPSQGHDGDNPPPIAIPRRKTKN